MICALPSCNEPVYIEPRTRIAHKYCGRSHAIEAGETLQAPHGKCMECNLRGCRKNVAFDAETGRVHDFCSRDHAQRAISRGEWAVPLREQGHVSASSSTQYCQFPRCGLPVYFDNTDRRYDYCGRSHAVEHRLLLDQRRQEDEEEEEETAIRLSLSQYTADQGEVDKDEQEAIDYEKAMRESMKDEEQRKKA